MHCRSFPLDLRPVCAASEQVLFICTLCNAYCICTLYYVNVYVMRHADGQWLHSCPKEAYVWLTINKRYACQCTHAQHSYMRYASDDANMICGGNCQDNLHVSRCKLQNCAHRSAYNHGWQTYTTHPAPTHSPTHTHTHISRSIERICVIRDIGNRRHQRRIKLFILSTV